MQGIPKTLTWLGPLGISTSRLRLGRYVSETSSLCICSRKDANPAFSMSLNVTPSLNPEEPYFGLRFSGAKMIFRSFTA
jgi:hypothetical protein